MSRGRSSGTANKPAPVDVGDEQLGGEPSLGGAVSDAAPLVVARMDDDPVADPGRVDVGADPLDRAGDLVAEAQWGVGRPGHAAHPDVGEIAATDAAGSHGHQRVVRAGIRRPDLVEPHVPRAVHPDLLHGPTCLRAAGSNKKDMASRIPASTISTRMPSSLRW